MSRWSERFEGDFYCATAETGERASPTERGAAEPTESNTSAGQITVGGRFLEPASGERPVYRECVVDGGHRD